MRFSTAAISPPGSTAFAVFCSHLSRLVGICIRDRASAWKRVFNAGSADVDGFARSSCLSAAVLPGPLECWFLFRARYHEKQGDATADDFGARNAAREAVLGKGQSKRIWAELYKVVDSSDVVVQVRPAQVDLPRCHNGKRQDEDGATMTTEGNESS